MSLWDLYQKIPKRYILALFAFLGVTNGAILRANMSIAIVAMVKPPDQHNTSLNHTTGFDWSPKTQQMILSSSFYAYAIMQIPAGILATVWGGKYFFGLGIGLCGFLTLFTPLCAHIGPGTLITLRILQSICSSTMLSSSMSLWSKWATKHDKSKLISLSVSGYFGGTFIAMSLGGLIAAHWTWEWIFYLSGISALLWAMLWFCFVTESPSEHPTITSQELNYIQSSASQTVIRDYSIPWKRILISLPVWSIIIAFFGTNLIMYTMSNELPMFLTHALHYRLDQAGGLAALPWLLFWLMVFVAGALADKLIQYYRTIYIRRIMILIAMIIIVLTLLCIILLNAQQRPLIVLFIMITICGAALSTSTCVVNHVEIGAQYAAFLAGLSNAFASIPGFLVPILTAYIVPHTNLKEEWNHLFMFLILGAILTFLFFIILAAGETQPWAHNNSGEYQLVLSKSGENNVDDLTNRLRTELNTANKIIE